MYSILFFLSFIFSNVVMAYHPSQWQAYEVPGAACGDGEPYKIFLRQGDSDKVLVEFMGGGACWSKDTCSFSNIRGWIHSVSFKTPEVVFDLDKFKSYQGVFFPYCTADVHMGNFIHDFDGLKVHYYGRSNFEKALQFLIDQNLIDFSRVKNFGVWGSSAGAIGALVYAHRFDAVLPPRAHRLLIADSPGLHFGKTFWQKFPVDLFRSIQRTSREAGLVIRRNQGLLAPAMGKVFERLGEWDIRLLFATRDWAMSDVYGDIDADEYRDLLLSDRGLPHIAAGYANVRTFLLESRGHALLIFPQLAEKQGINGQTAYDFLNKP